MLEDTVLGPRKWTTKNTTRKNGPELEEGPNVLPKAAMTWHATDTHKGFSYFAFKYSVLKSARYIT